MANPTPPPPTLFPRAPKGREVITITTNAGVTVFITDEVTVYQTNTVEKTVSVFDTSFITTTTTVTTTDVSTTTAPITITLTLTPTPPTTTPTHTGTINSSTSLLPLPTPFCTTPASAPVSGKHIDPFQVLSIVFGVFILFLLALMWFLVRRFYQMYRAERVLRKRGQMEGTEMPEMGKVVNDGGEERGEGGRE